jgi:hypothetical protein
MRSINKNINGSVKIEQSYQLWYNKYLYKSIFIIPGIHVLRHYYNESEIEANVQDLKEVGWKRALYSRFVESYYENKEDILKFANLTGDARLSKDLFIRIQDPRVSVYSNDLESHTRIEEAFPNALHSVSRPNKKCIPALLEGKNVMVVSKLPHNRYKYKVIINNYSTSHSIPKQLYEWGNAQGNAVKFSRKTEKYFKSPGLYLDQGFLYIEDESTLTMCNMFLTKCPKRVVRYVLESEL